MKFSIFPWRKGRARAAAAASDSTCSHPVSHQITLHDDPSDPKRVTGIRCSQCGQALEGLRDGRAS